MTSTDATSGVSEKLDALYEFERAPVTDDRLQPPFFVSGVAWMGESEKRRRSAVE